MKNAHWLTKLNTWLTATFEREKMSFKSIAAFMTLAYWLAIEANGNRGVSALIERIIGIPGLPLLRVLFLGGFVYLFIMRHYEVKRKIGILAISGPFVYACFSTISLAYPFRIPWEVLSIDWGFVIVLTLLAKIRITSDTYRIVGAISVFHAVLITMNVDRGPMAAMWGYGGILALVALITMVWLLVGGVAIVALRQESRFLIYVGCIGLFLYSAVYTFYALALPEGAGAPASGIVKNWLIWLSVWGMLRVDLRNIGSEANASD